MRKICRIIIILIFSLPLWTISASAESTTVMVYMCGSNLESRKGAATKDIQEMLTSGFDAEQVHVMLLAGGCTEWKNDPAFPSDQLSLYTMRTKGHGGVKLEPLTTIQGQSMGDSETLSWFLQTCMKKSDTDRYALVFWDHGGGPLEGVCYDELYGMDTLSLRELGKALSVLPTDEKKPLSWIGFDACLMASQETAQVCAPFAEYMIASQETEPGSGWNYQFLKGIENDHDCAATGIRIVDSYFEGENRDRYGITLSCLDLSAIDQVAEGMTKFFEPIGENMDAKTFAVLSALRTDSVNIGRAAKGFGDGGYDLVDLKDLIEHYRGFGDTSMLEEALSRAVVYTRSNKPGANGLSVYHALYNKEEYLSGWKDNYSDLIFSTGYQHYLDAFGKILTGRELADWTGILLSDDGFSAEMENLYSMTLTEEQFANFSSAQLIILGSLTEAYVEGEETYEMQLAEASTSGREKPEILYYPVWNSEVSSESNAYLRADFRGESLYLTDGAGTALAGPIGYELSDDGQEWYIHVTYRDNSSKENLFPDAEVLYTCARDEENRALRILKTEVFDDATETYTSRIEIDPENYTDMFLDRMARKLPEQEGTLPGLEEWESVGSDIAVSLPVGLNFEIINEQLSGTPLFATIEITDIQQNTYCTPLVRVNNPNLYDIEFSPRTYHGDGYELTLYAVMDNSQLTPGLSLGVELLNVSDQEVSISLDSLLANGTRSLHPTPIILSAGAGEKAYDIAHIDQVELTGIREVNQLEFTLSTGVMENGEEALISFTTVLSGCTNTRSADSPTAISTILNENQTWELVSLEKTLAGNLNAVIHVANKSPEPLHTDISMFVINNRIQLTAESTTVDVAGAADAFFNLEINNFLETRGIDVSGRKNSNVLGQWHILERFGCFEITELELITNTSKSIFPFGSIRESVTFDLEKPLSFSLESEYLEINDQKGLLLDDGISVQMDRILVGDDSLVYRMILTNRTDRDIELSFIEPQVNGEDDRQAFGSIAREYATYFLRQQCSMIVCDSYRWNTKELFDFSFAFRYEDFTSERAHVTFPSSVRYGQEGGVYLSHGDFITEPVSHGRPDFIRILPSMIETEKGNVSLSIGIENSELGMDPDEPIENQAKVRFYFSVTDKDDSVSYYNFDQFVINGSRVINQPIKRRSAGSDTWYLYIDRYSDPYGLTNIGEIREVSCIMNITDQNGSTIEIPLNWSVESCNLTGLYPVFNSPLSISSENGVDWELLSIRADKDYANNWFFAMHVQNHSDMTLHIKHILIDGKYAQMLIDSENRETYNIEIEPGMEYYPEIRLIQTSFDENYLYHRALLGGCLLQDEEGNYLHEIVVLSESDNVEATLYVKDPNELSEQVDPMIVNAMDNRLFLLRDEFDIGLLYALPGKDHFDMILSLKNNTDNSQTLTIRLSEGDDEISSPYRGKSQFELPPYVTRLERIRFYGEYSPEKKIRLSFFTEDAENYGTAVLWSDVPLLEGENYYLLPGNNYICVTAGEESVDEDINAQAQENQLVYEPIFVIRNTRTDEWREIKGEADPKKLKSGNEIFEPALKINNYYDQEISLGMYAIINGKSFSWPSFTVGAGEYYIGYTIGAEPVSGEYSCEFYVNGRRVFEGKLAIKDETEKPGNVFTFQNGGFEAG